MVAFVAAYLYDESGGKKTDSAILNIIFDGPTSTRDEAIVRAIKGIRSQEPRLWETAISELASEKSIFNRVQPIVKKGKAKEIGHNSTQ